MIREARLEDIDFINSVFKHPEIYPYISDDGSPQNIEEFSVMPVFLNPFFKFLIFESSAVFMLTAMNAITFEIHSMIWPAFRGKTAVEICRQGIEYVFANTNCKKLVTQIPVMNRAAYALAYKVGLRTEGVNKKSFLKNGILYDQYFMGITKEVF